MPKANLWILSPCYFDVSSFKKLRSDTLSSLISYSDKYDIKFALVDDSAGLDPGIKDLQAFSDVRLITPDFNLGHQRAIVFGIRLLRSEIHEQDLLVTMDSDGEDRPIDLPPMIQALGGDLSHHQIIIARRTKRKTSLKFRLMYSAFVILFRGLTGKILRSGNFALMPGRTAKKIIFHPYFGLCYSSSLVNINIPIVSVPCERGARYFDQSKMGYFNLIMHGFRMLMPYVDRIAMRAIIASGALVGLTGLTGLILLLLKITGYLSISNWYLSILFIGFVLSCLFLGIFLLLFTVFIQMQSLVLTKIDQ